jgi:hypothetical protein
MGLEEEEEEMISVFPQALSSSEDCFPFTLITERSCLVSGEQVAVSGDFQVSPGNGTFATGPGLTWL